MPDEMEINTAITVFMHSYSRDIADVLKTSNITRLMLKYALNKSQLPQINYLEIGEIQ